MDELEKSLIEEYGSGMITAEEVKAILLRCAANNLIERSDALPTGQMNVPSLVEYVSKLRRKFLYNDVVTEEDTLFNIFRNASDETRGTVHCMDDINIYKDRPMYTNALTHKISEEDNSSLQDSSTGRQVMDKVLKAYFEYEKMHMHENKQNKNRSVKFLIISGCIVLTSLLLGFFSYTPIPY